MAVIDVAKLASDAHSTPMVLSSERVQGKGGRPMDPLDDAPAKEQFRWEAALNAAILATEMYWKPNLWYIPTKIGLQKILGTIALAPGEPVPEIHYGADHATTLVISDNLTNYWYKRVNEQYKFTEDTFVKVWRAALLCKGISQLEVHNTAYLWPGLMASTLLQDFKMLKVLRIRKCPFFSLKDLQIATDFPNSIFNMNQEDLTFTVDFDFVLPTVHEDFANTGYRTTDTSYFEVYLPHLLRSHVTELLVMALCATC